jgi:D-cysteine desulfhydrase family pyridoxal phosphate-dependent enzyme
LAILPTPLEAMPRFSQLLGSVPVLIKRDDLTGLAGGGNKVRKLEFLVGDARKRGADTLVTVGGIQSNHVRQTAAAAARTGLGCQIILEDAVPNQDRAYYESGNLLLDRWLGAQIHFADRGEQTDQVIKRVLTTLNEQGHHPYFIPVGGSTPLGALGYVQAAMEIVEQLDERSLTRPVIILAAGSAGTHAGLVAGLDWLGRDIDVVGIAISGQKEDKSARVLELTRQTLALLGQEEGRVKDRIRVEDGFVGEGYGLPTTSMIDAVRSVATTEGIFLDPVYTGKAMAGLIELTRTGEFNDRDAIVFWHTGGSAALFAYPHLLQTIGQPLKLLPVR